MRTMMLLAAGALMLSPGFAKAMDCPVGLAAPLEPATLTPIATELAMADDLLGTPSGVLSQGADASQSVDQVLLRIRMESCRNMANIAPMPGAVDPNNPATYKPRTQFDNTPWRFNMSQNGKRMTADEFSAWMESKGVHVARGAGVPPAVVPVAAPVGTTPAQPAPTEVVAPPTP